MNRFKSTMIVICMASVFSAMVSGCATQGGATNGKSGDNNAALRCAGLGIGGALIGAFVGGTQSAVKGALIGLAACAVVEIASHQTKSAEVVEQQYRVSNRNQLPPSAKVDEYSTTVSPNGVVKAGDAIRVQSMIRAISGAKEPVVEVKEQLIVYAPSGEEFKRGEKKVNDASGSGEYVNTFTLKLPEGAPQGVYKFKTQLFLNGKPVVMRESNVQIAAHEIDTNQNFFAAQ